MPAQTSDRKLNQGQLVPADQRRVQESWELGVPDRYVPQVDRQLLQDLAVLTLRLTFEVASVGVGSFEVGNDLSGGQ